MVRKKFPFYKTKNWKNWTVHHLEAGRGSGKTQVTSIIINDLLKMNDVLKRWLIVVSILWCLTSIWSFMKTTTNNDLKRENEALKAQLEGVTAQKEHFAEELAGCIEFEQEIDKYCTCNFKEE